MVAHNKGPTGQDEPEEPVIRDKRKINPETGEVRQRGAAKADGLIEAEGPDVELSDADVSLLAEAEHDLVAEYRDRAARAEAELKNFRTRVERDRVANREAVIAEVIRTLLPAIDDLDRAESHGDLTEGSPLAIVAQKLSAGFERYGLRRVGQVAENFDPQLHEAIMQVPTAGATGNTIAEVIEPGYALGERLIRAAKVAVSVPE
ncbi:MAG: nucleotide exchange factor GrpE [Pseudolysinimonas sp.]